MHCELFDQEILRGGNRFVVAFNMVEAGGNQWLLRKRLSELNIAMEVVLILQDPGCDSSVFSIYLSFFSSRNPDTIGGVTYNAYIMRWVDTYRKAGLIGQSLRS